MSAERLDLATGLASRLAAREAAHAGLDAFSVAAVIFGVAAQAGGLEDADAVMALVRAEVAAEVAWVAGLGDAS